MEQKKKLWWKRRRLWTGLMFVIVSLIIVSEGCKTETVQAGVYDNAYTFYQNHGSEMAFLPGANNQGEIYYATEGKKNVSSGIRYTTIGWKVRVFNRTGALVDTIYYKLGGNHMTSVDVRTIEGYDYCLYRVTLTNLKSRLSKAGLDALSSPDCNIVFDACITTKINGVIQGGMTDSGPAWGDVYTTYNGIVHAQDWSSATQESLKSYYNKTVEGLFYDVTLNKGTGIRQVSGAGKYCFGTTVTVQAESEDGYHFSGWTGSKSSTSEKFSFVLYGNDINLTANAQENSYHIFFDGAGGQGSIPMRTLRYNDMLLLPTDGFWSEGASLSGWKTTLNRGELQFAAGQKVALKELVKQLQLQKLDGAKITLYALWDLGPMIKTEVIYVSLKDAVAGKITEEWMANRAEAFDQEDGEIPYGKNGKTSFFMENYKATDFTECQREGSVVETFFAMDSAGNTTRKEIQVHIVDTKLYPEDKIFGRVRFISKSYFLDENGNLIEEEMGGLAEDSIWRLDENYRVLLEKLFDSKN